MLPAGFYISCHPIHSLPVFIRCPRPSFSYPVFAPPSSRFPSWGVVVNCLSLLSAYRLSVPFVVSSGVPLCGAGRFCFPSRFVSGRLACRRSCSSFRRVGSFWRRAVFVSSFSRVVVLISFVPFVVSSARVVLRFVRSRRLACRPVVRFGFLRLVGRLVMRLVRRLVFSSYSFVSPVIVHREGMPPGLASRVEAIGPSLVFLIRPPSYRYGFFSFVGSSRLAVGRYRFSYPYAPFSSARFPGVFSLRSSRGRCDFSYGTRGHGREEARRRRQG